jgi:hypothetical protein
VCSDRRRKSIQERVAYRVGSGSAGRVCLREVTLSKWLWLFIVGILALTGCAPDQVVLLDSTPAERTPGPVVTHSTRSTVPGSPRVAQGTSVSPKGSLAEHSRRDWAEVAPIAMRLEPMGKITRITVHHCGEVNDLDSEPQIIDYLRRTQSSQCRTKAAGGLGAGDLAYHFIIDRNGETWEGRSLSYQGAHAGNSTANRGNVGICVLGNFNVQYPNDNQKASLKALLNRLTTRYDLGADDIYTHREIRAYYGLSATDCPGNHLQSVVDGMRRGFKSGRSVVLVREARR